MSLPIREGRSNPWSTHCNPWRGRPSEYQSEAKSAMQEMLDVSLPWVHVVPTCGTRFCLKDDHLRYFRAQKIEYPAYVCTYCGMPGYTKDHLLPKTITGEAARKFVAVVPACGECNSMIGDRIGHRVGERRDEAHERLRKKYRKCLESPQWTAKDLAELGTNLRTHIESSENLRDVVKLRLAWPHEPEYDLRAFQKSGIEDPYALDLI